MKDILASLLIIFLSITAFAQNGTIRGFVYDETTGEPIIFCNVYLEGTTNGSTTDIDGFYTIPNVIPGDYTLVCKYIGYDSLGLAISIKKNQLLNQKITLKQADIKLKEVFISAEKIARKKEVKVSSINITPQQLKHIPAIGGEPDIAQYLQILPGVVFTGDQGGQLYIRGGSPIQNKVILDGMTIYSPFHSIGLFSVFETDIIKNIDVYTGGFNAEYGGRISSIVDITTRSGNRKSFGGKISGSPFMAKGVFEGPIKKYNENGGSSSFVLSYKNSYLDRTSKSLYSYVDTAGLPYSFQDYYGKISFNGNNGSKLNLFGFSHNDLVDFAGTSTFKWNSFGFGTNFVLVPGGSAVLINGNFAFSDYKSSYLEANQQPRTSGINSFNLGLDFTYFIKEGEVKYGFEVLGFKTTFAFFNAQGIIIGQDQNTTELAGFLKIKKVLKKWVIEPSFRVQYYASLATMSPEPRIGAKYNVSDKTRLKLAGGVYSQNLISTKSDRDIVNLFNGYLSGPSQTLQNINGNDAKNNIQKALHAIVGVEYDITNHFEVNVETYVKDFTRLISLNRNKLFDTDPDFAIETGLAYGLDFLFKYEYKKLFIWTTYSLSWVNRNDGNQIYHPPFDRRHNINFVTSYGFGKKSHWEASVKWNLGSGFPFTLTTGNYEKLPFANGIGTNVLTQNGQLGTIYDDNINAGRLPFYHRLDASIKRIFYFGKNMELEANINLTNIYDRDNIFYVDRITKESVYQLPFLPSAGLSFKF